MSETNLIGQIDQAIGSFLSQWNITSTIIAGCLLIMLVLPLLTSRDPDTHAFLLARQAQASPIRQQGESAVYRSTEIPYGYPLRSGLGIKDPGAAKWTSGRDGDLRDIWRAAVNGTTSQDGSSSGATAKINTVLGVEKVIEHDLKSLTVDINVIGKHIKDAGGRKVAICLSNSVELLCTVFAGAFYNFSPVLIPYHQQPDASASLLEITDFDTLVAEAGSVALEKLLSQNKSIRRIIWVAKESSKHLDWSEVPQGVGGKLDVDTWHNLIEDKRANSSNEVPPLDKDNEPPSIFVCWPNKAGTHELIEYTQKNILAGTSAIYASLPRTQKLTSSSSLLPTTPLSQSYTLSFSLLALYSGSTLLLTSVAGSTISILGAANSARQLLKPTHITADARAIPRFLEDVAALSAKDRLGRIYAAWSTSRAVAQGYMDVAAGSKPGYLPSSLGALQTLYISQPDVVKQSEWIRSSTLAQLRLLLNARVALALTSGRVAGFVTMGNALDYTDKGDVCCVGAVASSLELCLVGEEAEMAKTDGVGRVAVRGPAVVGSGSGKERVVLDVRALVDRDSTVLLALK